MNILLLGNGFDLAHGLPTQYKDFLGFLKCIKQVLQVKIDDDLNTIAYKTALSSNLSKEDVTRTAVQMN